MPTSRSERAREQREREIDNTSRSAALCVFYSPLSLSRPFGRSLACWRVFSDTHVHAGRGVPTWLRPVVLKPRALTLALSSRKKPPASRPEERTYLENWSGSGGGTGHVRHVKSDSIFADGDTVVSAKTFWHGSTRLIWVLTKCESEVSPELCRSSYGWSQ